jgi:hypothetical protein
MKVHSIASAASSGLAATLAIVSASCAGGDSNSITLPVDHDAAPATSATAVASDGGSEASSTFNGDDGQAPEAMASRDAGNFTTSPGAGSGNEASANATPGTGNTVSTASATVPTIGGCALFPADNPWNTRVDDTSKFPVHAQSDTFIANMGGAHLHADWGPWSTDKYGIPWQTVPGSQPMVPMTFDYADESDPGPYPFPPNPLVEGGANSGGDMHVLVVDTGNCSLYETWNSTYVGPGWSCGSGAKFDLTSNALRPAGWTSSDAAGLPVLPGLVRVSEVNAGAIRHAIRFTVARTQQGYIHPATHAAGLHNPSLPPMGLRLRLKASFDVSQFTGAPAVILKAMQQYGLMLADNGSNWFVSGDSDDGWAPLMDAVNAAFGQVHGSDFEAVDTGPVLTDGL